MKRVKTYLAAIPIALFLFLLTGIRVYAAEADLQPKKWINDTTKKCAADNTFYRKLQYL